MRIRPKDIFVALVLGLFAGCSTVSYSYRSDSESSAREGYQAGSVEARHDLATGKLAVETYGFPVECSSEYAQLLRERHGIELRPVAGCVVDARIAGHARGYNEIMMPEIERRFGTNVWQQTMADAQRLYARKVQTTR